jgi:FMN-dependent oxidoreductase (nitrilotriacetate monooxygenase family)
MSDPTRQMKLGMFYWPCGHHLAAWRHPDAVPDSGANLPHLIELARIAERGLFDMFFMADSLSFWRGNLEAMAHDSFGTAVEPFTLMCTLAQHTKNIGLVCTSTTTYDQPYLLARRFASLDLMSGGRAGWNLITSANKAEAACFGYEEHMEKAERYRRAREFAHVVRGLWNSWEDGVFVRDKETSRYYDTEKLHVLEHEGPHFRARGPLNVPPSPQGEPVMIQAGASDDGRELAAATAEVIFGAQQTLAGAQEFYADVKGRMAAYGREPDGLKIMPGLLVCVGETNEEAHRKYEQLQDLIDPRVGMELLSKRLDFDLTGYPVDEPLPEMPENKIVSTRRELFVEIGRRENLTIRDLYKRISGARGHMEVIGTPVEIVDMMEEWVTEKGCDGFNIMPPVFPGDLEDFVDHVVPELQRRGLYRTAYSGTTFRDNLGLTRPPWSPDDLEKLTLRDRQAQLA